MITVNVPGLGQVQFPDGTSESVMHEAIQRALRNKGAGTATAPLLPSSHGLDTSDDKPGAAFRRHQDELRAAGDMLPTEAMEPLGPDPGAVMPALRQMANTALGPVVGGLEWAGKHPILSPEAHLLGKLVEPGTNAEMQQGLADEQVNAMAHGHTLAQGLGVAGGVGLGFMLPGGTSANVGESLAAAAATRAGVQSLEHLPTISRLGVKAAQAAVGGGEGAALGYMGAEGLGDEAQNKATVIGGLMGLGGSAMSGMGPEFSRAGARIDALRHDLSDAGKLAANSATPEPHVGGQMWTEYNQAKANIDIEGQQALQQAAAQGVNIPPETVEQLRAAKFRAVENVWHERAATQAAISTEPAIHSLADATEQTATFEPAPPLPDAALFELQKQSLDIAEVESRPERLYRGEPLHSDDPNSRTYIYRDPNTGEEVGYLLAHPVEGGFKAKHVWVEESHRGASIPEHLYTKASEELGPYKGSTDYAGRRSAAGQRMNERLQRTVPHVFTDEGSGAPLLPATTDLIRAADPKKSVRQILTDTANRFIEEFSDKKDPAIRVLRDAGLGNQANELELWVSQARGASRVASNLVWKGVRHWDAVNKSVTRSYDSLHSIIGGLGPGGWRDINDMLAAENHMELVSRKQTADTEYANALAERRADIESRRQDVTAARAANRAVTAAGRQDLAAQLRATRNEAKAGGEAGVRYANARRSARMGRRGELNTDLDLALSATGRQGRAQSAIDALPTPSDTLSQLTGTAKLLEQAATARYHKLPPRAQRPADSSLKIDPRGTAWAKSKLAELQQRYGPDPDTGVGIARLSETARRIREWSWNAVVEQLDQVGYFTPEGKAALAAKRQQFAPFARLADEVVEDLGLVTGTHSKPIKGISGGLSPDKPIAEPLESFVAQAQRIQLWVERQRTYNLLGDAAEAFPVELGDKIKKMPPNSKGGFQVFRDGARHVYSAPDDVLRALGRLDTPQVHWALEAGVIAARMLRAGVTLSPDFAVRNFIRDLSTSGVYGADRNIAKDLMTFRPLTDFATGMWAQTPFASGPLREMVAKWEGAGGALGDIISIERPKATYTAKAAAGVAELKLPGGKTFDLNVGRRFAKSVEDWRAEGVLGKIVFPILRPLESAASSVEQATRIGAFRRAKLRGANDLEASFHARNITLDFGRSGATGQRWNSIEAFANASLQDVARYSRAMRDNPVGTTISALTYITLPSLATYFLNRDNPDYQSRPQWEKASFYHLAQREDKTWVMFPRPPGMLNLVYGYGAEQMLEAMRGKYDEPVTQLLSTVFNETPLRYSPVQPDPDPNAGIRGSMEGLPTLIQPAVEAGASEEGWSQLRQSPLVPKALLEMLPEDRFTDTTSQAARSLGKATGIAPLKIDHLIRNYTGTLGVQTIKGVVDPAINAVTGNSTQLPPLPTTANDIPVVGTFVSGSPYGFATQPVQDFYSLEESTREAHNSWKAAASQANADDYHRILREHPEVLIYKMLSKTKDDLADLRKTRNAYRTNASLTPEMRAEWLLQTDMLISQRTTSTMHWVASWRQGLLKANSKK